MSFRDIPPYLFVVAFIALWCGVCFLLGTFGGWRTLSNYYRLRDSFHGEKWRFRSAYFRSFVSYSNMLTLGASERGLYMAVLFMFRVGHPPLLIPWEHVRKAPRGTFSFMSTPLMLGDHSPVRMSVSTKLVERFEEIAGKPFEPART